MGISKLVIVCSLFGAKAFAEDVRYLERPQQALSAFMEMVDSAQTSVDMATFIFEPCHSSTQLLLEKLSLRAKQGVRVRILMDALQQKTSQEQFLSDYAAKHGMQVKFYNRNELNLRLHIKMMVVDSKRYISGGRNISDEYFGLSGENNYLDRDVMVEGPSARQATTSFEELWTSKISKSSVGVPSRFKDWTSYCAKAAKPTVSIDKIRNYLIEQGSRELAQVRTHSCERVTFVTDAPDFAHAKYGIGNPKGRDDNYMSTARMNRKRTTKSVLSFIKEAKSSLDMENWVYFPLWKLNLALKDVRNRQVQIHVLTNEDIEDGPQFFRNAMDYAIKRHAERDSEKNMKVVLVSSKGALKSPHFELTPTDAPVHLHGKIMIRDQRDALVGSFNLDARSYNTNLESAVVIKDCQSLTSDMKNAFEELVNINADDRVSGRIPAKAEPSFLEKLFANTSLAFL